MEFGDLVLLALLLPGVLIVGVVVAVVLPRALRDEDRLNNNLCLHCGYDLRESEDRCPECGQPSRPPERF